MTAFSKVSDQAISAQDDNLRERIKAQMRNLIHAWIAMLKKRSFKAMCASMLLLANAACEADAGKADIYGKSADPIYARPVALKGQYILGEETSSFYPCHASREKCVAAPLRGQRNCWMQFTQDLQPQMSAKIAGHGPEGGRFWLEGIGRVSSGPGNYGHLGAYSCQIEISRIDAFDAYPAVPVRD